MVVKQGGIELSALDLGHLGLFLGLRMNELVMEAAERAGFTEFRESHGYVIQHFVEGGRAITELARRMEITQQAASKSVAELVRIGILEATPSDDRRSKRIQLSDSGWRLVKLARRRRREIERQFIARVGEQSYQDARAALIQCLGALGYVEKIASRRVRAPR